MGELVENVIDNHWMVECKDGMNSERVRRAKAVLAYFGPDRLVSDAFSEKSITDYRKALVAKATPMRPSTSTSPAIKTMLRSALKKGVLGARPDIVMMPKVKKKKYIITKDEGEALSGDVSQDGRDRPPRPRPVLAGHRLS